MMDNGDVETWRVKSNNLGTSGNVGVQEVLQPETQKNVFQQRLNEQDAK